MSINATHWANICSAVEEHARKLYPNNTDKRRELVEELLCIQNRETMLLKSVQADAAVKNMNKPSLSQRLKYWLGQ